MYQEYAGEQYPRSYSPIQVRAAHAVRKAVRRLALNGTAENERKMRRAKDRLDTLRQESAS